MSRKLITTTPHPVRALAEGLELRQFLATFEYEPIFGTLHVTTAEADEIILIEDQKITIDGVVHNQTWSRLILNAMGGNDRITSKLTWSRVEVDGGAGDDILIGSAIDESFNGGPGNDSIVSGDGSDHLFGDAGQDTLVAGSGNDRIFGGLGDDTIDAGAGDDSVTGGLGADHLTGGDGNDSLIGDAGNDTLDGGSGSDLLSGQLGEDLLWGGADNDSLHGGHGNDTLNDGAAGDDRLREDETAAPLAKLTTSRLKALLIRDALKQWEQRLGQTMSPYYERRFYEQDSDGRLILTERRPHFAYCNDPLCKDPDYKYTGEQKQSPDELQRSITAGKLRYRLQDRDLVIEKQVSDGSWRLLSTSPIGEELLALYLQGDRLAVLSRGDRFEHQITCPGFQEHNPLQPGMKCQASRSTFQRLAVTVLQISRGSRPIRIQMTSLDGDLVTSRHIDGKLYFAVGNSVSIPGPRATWHEEPPLPLDFTPPPIVSGRDQGDARHDAPVQWYWNGTPVIEQVTGYLAYESKASYRERLRRMPLKKLLSQTAFALDKHDQFLSKETLIRPSRVYLGRQLRDNDGHWNMLSLVAVDISQQWPHISASATIIGEEGIVYLSPENVYLAVARSDVPTGDYDSAPEMNSDIHKLRLNHNSIDHVATGLVPGWVADPNMRFTLEHAPLPINSMNERNGLLRLATTSTRYFEFQEERPIALGAAANLLVLQQQGRQLAPIAARFGFELNTTLISAEFKKDSAYLTTYRDSDVIVVDLNKLRRPGT